jgi:hypothetical protein
MNSRAQTPGIPSEPVVPHDVSRNQDISLSISDATSLFANHQHAKIKQAKAKWFTETQKKWGAKFGVVKPPIIKDTTNAQAAVSFDEDAIISASPSTVKATYQESSIVPICSITLNYIDTRYPNLARTYCSEIRKRYLSLVQTIKARDYVKTISEIYFDSKNGNLEMFQYYRTLMITVHLVTQGVRADFAITQGLLKSVNYDQIIRENIAHSLNDDFVKVLQILTPAELIYQTSIALSSPTLENYYQGSSLSREADASGRPFIAEVYDILFDYNSKTMLCSFSNFYADLSVTSATFSVISLRVLIAFINILCEKNTDVRNIGIEGLLISLSSFCFLEPAATSQPPTPSMHGLLTNLKRFSYIGFIIYGMLIYSINPTLRSSLRLRLDSHQKIIGFVREYYNEAILSNFMAQYSSVFNVNAEETITYQNHFVQMLRIIAGDSNTTTDEEVIKTRVRGAYRCCVGKYRLPELFESIRSIDSHANFIERLFNKTAFSMTVPRDLTSERSVTKSRETPVAIVARARHSDGQQQQQQQQQQPSTVPSSASASASSLAQPPSQVGYSTLAVRATPLTTSDRTAFRSFAPINQSGAATEATEATMPATMSATSHHQPRNVRDSLSARSATAVPFNSRPNTDDDEPMTKSDYLQSLRQSIRSLHERRKKMNETLEKFKRDNVTGDQVDTLSQQLLQTLDEMERLYALYKETNQSR